MDQGFTPQGFEITIALASSTSQESHQPTLPHKISSEPILCHLLNIEKYKMSQPHMNENINSFNTNHSFNNVYNYSVADEKSEILTWLSPLEPQSRHQDIRILRVDKVGGWLLQTEEYRNWFAGRSGGKSDFSALFCCGGPGVGKTYIRYERGYDT